MVGCPKPPRAVLGAAFCGVGRLCMAAGCALRRRASPEEGYAKREWQISNSQRLKAPGTA
eukprot:10973583-Alexandrium_andersonii.AAC.1